MVYELIISLSICPSHSSGQYLLELPLKCHEFYRKYSPCGMQKHIAILRSLVKFRGHTGQKKWVKWFKFGDSVHSQESAWKKWPEIWHDVSWPPSELIKLWSWSVDFPHLVHLWLNEMGEVWGFHAFSGEHMWGIASNLAYTCILTTFRMDYILGHSLLIFLLFGGILT